MSLPESFAASMRVRLGGEADAFFAALETDAPVSVRFNPYKLSEKPEGLRVPWSRYGSYLDERPAFTLDPLFHAGAYYVQEASSMFLEHIVRETSGDGPLRVLDMCAAPGGKTTLLSAAAGTEGLVVANEVIRQRAQVLADNVRKWGLGNVVVTSNDPEHFGGVGDFFDVAAVDAPCSGEGMFRKDKAARSQWSENSVALCAARQRRILGAVWDSLAPGGLLIYSTCTFNTRENEDNVRWLWENYDVEPVEMPVDGSWGIVRGEVEGIGTFRFYPHRVAGEGLFVAVMRKARRRAKTVLPRSRRRIFSDMGKGEAAAVAGWVARSEQMRFSRIGDNVYGYYAGRYDEIKAIAEALTVLYSGVPMGQLYGGKLRPEHSLALFHDLDAGMVPRSDFDLGQARDYLRRKDPDPALLAEGINLIVYSGLPIGWAKRIDGRVNNMYPKELRILNL